MTQRALPPAKGDEAPKADVTVAMVSTDPREITDGISRLRARQRYLQSFIERKLEGIALPVNGTGQPASVELEQVEEQIRVLSFRIAFSTRSTSIVPPLPEFDIVNRGFTVDGRPADSVLGIMATIPNAEAKQQMVQFLNSTGQALVFTGRILQIEGAKGFSRAGTPTPDRAFSAFRSKFDALRASLKTDPKAKMTIRRDVLDSAKEDPNWNKAWDRVMALYTDPNNEKIVIYDKPEVGASPTILLGQLQKERDAIIARAEKGAMTDDDLDRLPELSLQIERLTGKVR